MDNAAARDNFVSGLYEESVKQEKNFVLDTLVAPEYAALHRDAAIHLHDLEGYRYVYNCCTPALQDILDVKKFVSKNDFCKMAEVFDKIKSLITSLAVCQTGGIGFANFDIDVADVLEKLNVPFSEANQAIMTDLAALFLKWENTTYTRYCREPYYISLNLGLATSDWGRFVTKSILKAYFEQPIDFERPNIIFKVKKGVNADAADPNHDLFLQALQCTAHRMVPTYLLLDSEPNRGCDPEKLGIMGCRTRVYQNSNGAEQTIGRGNIAYVSINLPRIALQSDSVDDFMKKLGEKALVCKDILLARMETLKKTQKLGFVFENHLWNKVANMEELVKQGTLSLGFIGISETVEILTGEKMYLSKNAEDLGYSIVKELRKYADDFRRETGLNFSLLATPGELISGRFADADKKKFNHPVLEKGFYTNSFHAEVDSGLSIYDKLRLEGKFHALCNGGSISYVEFNDAPMENIEALEDLVAYATAQGVSYLGMNFPLDICRDCKHKGTFDDCPVCGSKNIRRIRRVSGYLEDLDYFTSGKKREVAKRSANNFGKNSGCC